MENRKKNKKGLIISFIIIILFAGFTVSNYLKAKKNVPVKSIAKVKAPIQAALSKTVYFNRNLELVGDVRPFSMVDIFPKIPGKIIEKIFVEKGDLVKKGDLVAVLESSAIEARIEEAGAALESAQARVKQAQANLEILEKDRERLVNLYQQKAIALQKVDHIEAQYTAALESRRLATAQVKQARAAIKQLTISYNDHWVYAPAGGYISTRYVDKGAMSAPGKPLFRISDENILKIISSVAEKEFLFIKKGLKVVIKTGVFPDKEFSGVVSIISPTINPTTRTGEIEIQVKNAKQTLRSGMFVRVFLNFGQRQVTAVSRDALVRLPGTGSYYVYVVKEKRAVLTNIKVGIFQNNLVEVREGLSPGEKVIIKGLGRIKDGVLVSETSDPIKSSK